MASQARKLLWTLHDWTVNRLSTGGWTNVTIIKPKDGWPEDKKLKILEAGESLGTGEVAVPCLKLNMDDDRGAGGRGLGEAVALGEVSCDYEFQAESIGQEIDLREFLKTSLEDVILFLLDWTKYPQTPAPDPLYQLDIEDIVAVPAYNYGSPNTALRYGGIVRFTVVTQRTETPISNVS